MACWSVHLEGVQEVEALVGGGRVAAGGFVEVAATGQFQIRN